MFALRSSAATANSRPVVAAVRPQLPCLRTVRWASNSAPQPPVPSPQKKPQQDRPTAPASPPATAPGSAPPLTPANGPAAEAPAETPKSLPRRMFTAVYNVFSKEKRLEKRPQLQKEYRESYWKDLQELNKTKGKLSIAPPDLNRAATAKLFPPLTVTSLSDLSTDLCLATRLQGHVTLVTLACSTYGDNQTKSFEIPFRLAYPDVPVYQISMADTYAKAWVLKMNMRYTRAKMAQDQWANYFVSTKLPVDKALEELQVTNKYVGWVFLVDHRGRVRWRANGVATEAELEALGSGAETLVKEMDASTRARK